MGPIQLLFRGEVFSFVALATVLVVALALHEFGHAAAATAQGDLTARNAGRLTINPLAHLDPVGTFLLLFAGFGWGKPVPFNPHALRSRRFGAALVGAAGPAVNILLALAAGALYVRVAGPTPSVSADVLAAFLTINVTLAVFNLIPIPPLDGSRVLSALLPPSRQNIVFFLDKWGLLILLVLVFFVLPAWLPPAVGTVGTWILRLVS